jgi:predicted RNase H-like HicB family nuclease
MFSPVCCTICLMSSKLTSQLTFTVQFFLEGKTFIAYNPELDVSSCGHSLEEAKKNIRDAIRGFLKSAARIGTLSEILEQAGYVYRRKHWTDPNLIAMDRMSVPA